jgi:hypothetical protein
MGSVKLPIMKNLKLIACSFLFISFSSFAQIDDGNYDVSAAFKAEISAHDSSPVIQGFITEVETSYGVICEGFTAPVYPYIQNHLTYRATCTSEEQNIKLVLKSKYSSTNGSFVFFIRKSSLKFR